RHGRHVAGRRRDASAPARRSRPHRAAGARRHGRGRRHPRHRRRRGTSDHADARRHEYHRQPGLTSAARRTSLPTGAHDGRGRRGRTGRLVAEHPRAPWNCRARRPRRGRSWLPTMLATRRSSESRSTIMFELVLGSGVVVAVMLVVAVDITVTTDGEPGDGVVSHVVAGALVIAILMGGWYV